MPEKYAIVITTINEPTQAIKAIAREAGRLDAQFIIVGDQKTPSHFEQAGSIYLSLQTQASMNLRYSELAPTQHYARKNIGYLHAIANGSTVIIETDDDNIPYLSFWLSRNANAIAHLVETETWINVYRYFQQGLVWPRGLPLDQVNISPPQLSGKMDQIYCPIQQGLANNNPDVDAIYRLLLPLPLSFNNAEPVALRNAWCPFNSQNTTWWAAAFPLLYLPYHCSFRMTDIWRSFVAQRILYANGWSVLFHSATVFQDRNTHDLMRDFAEEVPGYLHNSAIRDELNMLSIRHGVEHIPDNMRICYERLVSIELIKRDELSLLEAWLEDIASACRAQPVES